MFAGKKKMYLQGAKFDHLGLSLLSWLEMPKLSSLMCYTAWRTLSKQFLHYNSRWFTTDSPADVLFSFGTFSWALLPRQPGLRKALRDCSMIQLRYMSSHAALESISWANDNYPGGCETPIIFLSPYQADGSFPLVTYCQREPLGSPTEGFLLQLFIDENTDA